MSARYMPLLDFPALLQEQRVEGLQERLAAARLAALAAQTPERVQEIADEIATIESLWNKEQQK